MTYFLDFRTRDVGGAVVDPTLYEGDGTVQPLNLTRIQSAAIPSRFAGKNVLFATHGFNVSRTYGANSLGIIEHYLNLPAPDVFVAMLWPGDSVLPIVDYPFEGGVAEDCGNRLATFCNTSCVTAQSISFFSHSLGARMVLQAITRLDRRAHSVCLAAAAINRDCLITQYASAAQNSDQISLLASHNDYVLKLAFSIGDPFAVLLHDDHTPFQPALGYDGPPTPAAPPILAPWQIGDAENYGHLDYLPPKNPVLWPRTADFMKRGFLGQRQIWPS
jgi:hypothetical protein